MYFDIYIGVCHPLIVYTMYVEFNEGVIMYERERERNACVRHQAEKHLQKEDALTQKIFKPAVVVRDALIKDPGTTRKVLAAAVKRKVKSGGQSEATSGARPPESGRDALCHYLGHSSCVAKGRPDSTIQHYEDCP